MSSNSLLIRAYLSFIVVKGIAMGIVATILNVDFYRALILVLVSAIVTGAFGIVIATIQSRENKHVHERLEQLEITGRDIRGAIGADKRETDSKTEEKK